MVPEEWKENFRMTKTSFMNFYEQLRPHIQRKSSNMRSPVEVERQVAATIYYLSNEGRLRTTANAFGLSKSCVSINLRRVCRAITIHLGPKYIRLPRTDVEVRNLVKQFFDSYGVPQCIGAIDGTHTNKITAIQFYRLHQP